MHYRDSVEVEDFINKLKKANLFDHPAFTRIWNELYNLNERSCSPVFEDMLFICSKDKPLSVKYLRDQADITQVELSGMSGISVRTIQEWEQGRRKPNQLTLSFIGGIIDTYLGRKTNIYDPKKLGLYK